MDGATGGCSANLLGSLAGAEGTGAAVSAGVDEISFVVSRSRERHIGDIPPTIGRNAAGHLPGSVWRNRRWPRRRPTMAIIVHAVVPDHFRDVRKGRAAAAPESHAGLTAFIEFQPANARHFGDRSRVIRRRRCRGCCSAHRFRRSSRPRRCPPRPRIQVIPAHWLAEPRCASCLRPNLPTAPTCATSSHWP